MFYKKKIVLASCSDFLKKHRPMVGLRECPIHHKLNLTHAIQPWVDASLRSHYNRRGQQPKQRWNKDGIHGGVTTIRGFGH